MSELVRGSSVPLFDRLSAATHVNGNQLLTPAQLERSIGRELFLLMNTRSRIKLSDYAACTGTVIDYGIPDITSLSPGSFHGLDLLQTVILKAITFYEPRLKNVSVKAFAAPKAGAAVSLMIMGTVMIDMKLRQLNFELELDPFQAQSSKAA